MLTSRGFKSKREMQAFLIACAVIGFCTQAGIRLYAGTLTWGMVATIGIGSLIACLLLLGGVEALARQRNSLRPPPPSDPLPPPPAA